LIVSDIIDYRGWACLSVRLVELLGHLHQSDTEAGPPTIVDDVAYYKAGSHLFAMDLPTGRERWRFRAEPSHNVSLESTPAVTDTTVYFADGAGCLHAVDSRSGEQRWGAQLGESLASPAL